MNVPPTALVILGVWRHKDERHNTQGSPAMAEQSVRIFSSSERNQMRHA